MSTDPGFDPSATAPPSNPPAGFEGGMSGGPGYSHDPGLGDSPVSTPPPGFDGGMSGGDGGYSHDPGQGGSSFSPPPGFGSDSSAGFSSDSGQGGSSFSSPPGFGGDSSAGFSSDSGQGGSSFSSPPGFGSDSPVVYSSDSGQGGSSFSPPPGFAHDTAGDTHGKRAEGQQTEQQIAEELERRTGKSIDELILSLGRGPVQIDMRALERALEDNGSIKHRIEDHTPQKIIDNVTVPHSYQERRYVTEGRVGTEEQVNRAQEIGRDQVSKDFVSGMMSGLRGGAKTGESPQPLGAGRVSDSAADKSVTTDSQSSSHLHSTGNEVAPDPPASR